METYAFPEHFSHKLLCLVFFYLCQDKLDIKIYSSNRFSVWVRRVMHVFHTPGDTLTIFHFGSCQGSYFQATIQWWAYFLKSSTRKELWFYWSIYVTVFHLIGRSKMSERLPNMTLNRVLLNVSALPNFKKKGYNKHLMTGFS